MADLGIVILSRLWFENKRPLLEEILLGKINKKDIVCLQIRNCPIIGISESRVFSDTAYGWNRQLAVEMGKKLRSEYPEIKIFMALHDKHIGYDSSEKRIETDSWDPQPDGQNMVFVFQHDQSDNLYNILKNHIGKIDQGNFDIGAFQKDISSYANDSEKKNNITKANCLRKQLLDPLMPFHMFSQLDSLPAHDREWQELFDRCRAEMLSNGGDILSLILSLRDYRNDIKENIRQSFNDVRSCLSDNNFDPQQMKDCRNKIERLAGYLEVFLEEETPEELKLRKSIRNVAHD